MLPKIPKSKFWSYIKRGAATLFVVEAFAFVGSYGIFHRMNTDRGMYVKLNAMHEVFRNLSEFRKYMKENYSFILNYYYKFGEIIGSSNLREIDNTIWHTQKIEQDKGQK